MAKRITRHNRKILNEHYLSNKIGLKPGMILKFNYYQKDAFDKYPLILYLYRDRKKNLIHGLNLNYLLENEVRLLFGDMSQKVNTVLLDKDDPQNKLGSTYTFVKFKNTGEVAKAERRDTYRFVIKDFMEKRNLDIYRTYFWNSLSNLKVIEYQF